MYDELMLRAIDVVNQSPVAHKDYLEGMSFSLSMDSSTYARHLDTTLRAGDLPNIGYWYARLKKAIREEKAVKS